MNEKIENLLRKKHLIQRRDRVLVVLGETQKDRQMKYMMIL
jgi:hypothetical protein